MKVYLIKTFLLTSRKEAILENTNWPVVCTFEYFDTRRWAICYGTFRGRFAHIIRAIKSSFWRKGVFYTFTNKSKQVGSQEELISSAAEHFIISRFLVIEGVWNISKCLKNFITENVANKLDIFGFNHILDEGTIWSKFCFDIDVRC